MTSPVARVGDPGSHGGAIQAGSPSMSADGKAVARVGDTYLCAIHGPVPMSSGSGSLSAEGKAVCRVGDTAACGAIITAGSPTFSSS